MAEIQAVSAALHDHELTARQCRFFADLARKVSRINIDPAKDDFLRLRLTRRLRALNLEGFDAYENLLRQDPSGPEIRLFVEALTTHTTSFFREGHQFDWLRDQGIDQLTQTGAGFDRPLTLWSAACSTGAELWSAAMVIADKSAEKGGLRRYTLLGTDISHAILKKASGATYAQNEVAGISAPHMARYVMRSKRALRYQREHLYRIVPELRRNAQFAYANLTEPDTLPAIAADVVFLRNVLIYFESDMQMRTIDGIIQRMRTGGVLLTGHAEAIPSHPALRSVGPSIYVKE